MLVEGYYGRLGMVRSLNSVNQINIAYGNTTTPQEVVELEHALSAAGYTVPQLHPDRSFSDEELSTTLSDWIGDAFALLQLIGKEDAEPFLRRDLRQSMTLYTDGGSPSEKTLIVAVPGANNRLMMPIATLLQALDARTADLVVIRDPSHTAFFKGLEGFAETRDALIDALPGYLNFGSYRRVASLGVSAGGLPALLIAIRLGLQSALVCGGDTPLDPRQHDIGGPAAAAALAKAAEQESVGGITIAYGAQHEADRLAARELADFLGIEPLAITNAKGNVLHNLLYALAEEGGLPGFLAERLGL